jgi:hypothetical protein
MAASARRRAVARATVSYPVPPMTTPAQPTQPARPSPPRAHLTADPRFRGVLQGAMKKYHLEEYFEHSVVKLVTGETDPRTLICCNTGCRPCAKDYLGAAETVLRQLAKKRKRFLFW